MSGDGGEVRLQVSDSDWRSGIVKEAQETSKPHPVRWMESASTVLIVLAIVVMLVLVVGQPAFVRHRDGKLNLLSVVAWTSAATAGAGILMLTMPPAPAAGPVSAEAAATT